MIAERQTQKRLPGKKALPSRPRQSPAEEPAFRLPIPSATSNHIHLPFRQKQSAAEEPAFRLPILRAISNHLHLPSRPGQSAAEEPAFRLPEPNLIPCQVSNPTPSEGPARFTPQQEANTSAAHQSMPFLPGSIPKYRVLPSRSLFGTVPPWPALPSDANITKSTNRTNHTNRTNRTNHTHRTQKTNPNPSEGAARFTPQQEANTSAAHKSTPFPPGSIPKYRASPPRSLFGTVPPWPGLPSRHPTANILQPAAFTTLFSFPNPTGGRSAPISGTSLSHLEPRVASSRCPPPPQNATPNPSPAGPPCSHSSPPAAYAALPEALSYGPDWLLLALVGFLTVPSVVAHVRGPTPSTASSATS